MESIKIFQNEQFGKVRVAMNESNEPLFCLADVAKALGYSNPAKAVIDHCKGVTVLETPTNGGVQPIKYGKESEIYRLTMKSKLPDAEKFQDWVCDEVLPSIRKHGAYMTSDVLEKAIASPDFTIGLLTKLKEEQERRLVAENKVKRQQSIIEEQTPLANLGDAVMKYDGDITINELAKLLCQNGYETGERRLRYRLKEDGFLMQNGDPTQKSVENRLMAIIKGTYMHPINGETMYHKTMITTKGQKYFINKYLKPREYAN